MAMTGVPSTVLGLLFFPLPPSRPSRPPRACVSLRSPPARPFALRPLALSLHPPGKYTGTFKTFAICGYLRDKGESDMALTELARNADARK